MDYDIEEIANEIGQVYYYNLGDGWDSIEDCAREFMKNMNIDFSNEEKEKIITRSEYHADFWEYKFVKDFVEMVEENNLQNKASGQLESYNIDKELYNNLIEYRSGEN